MLQPSHAKTESQCMLQHVIMPVWHLETDSIVILYTLPSYGHMTQNSPHMPITGQIRGWIMSFYIRDALTLPLETSL